MGSAADAFENSLIEALAGWGVSPTAEQLTQFGRHYQMLVEANRSFNLTRIVEPVDAAIKHFADSLSVVSLLRQRPRRVASMLDIGTGPGFPALPLAVMYPEWRVMAIDGTGKKVAFVRRAATSMGLSKVEAVHAHSSHWTSPEKFDLVVLRAVAALDVCVSQGSRFVAKGGTVVAFKSADVDKAELDAAGQAATTSGMMATEPFVYELGSSDGRMTRALHLFETGGGLPGVCPSNGHYRR